MARVRFNGHDLGTIWCAPWRIEIGSAMVDGSNSIEIEVANLWPNRLIGDERFPDDCADAGTWRTGPLPAWPNWFLNGKPRPEPRRVSFTTFKHWRSDDSLLPSGLLGPVTLKSRRVVSLPPTP